MPFPEFSSTRKRKDVELRILDRWKKEQIFQKQVKQTAGGPLFTFYEGPPTANGKPGIHHVLSRVFKDIYVRYYGQKGFHVPRKAGWDCHGLPVEREVEKELGITAKIEIEQKVGLEKFNELCRKNVMKYVSDWNAFSERMGFWIDLEDAYFTMDNDYIESVWGLLAGLWKKGLIEKSYKVVPVDPVMGSTLSDAEVAQGYKTVEDPSLTVRFKIESGNFAGASILVWTTTPWTLPSNVALAVNADEEYVLVESGKDEEGAAKEKVIFAEKLTESIFANTGFTHKIIKKFKGSDLAGTSYTRLFDWAPLEEGAKACYVVTADFVTMDTGTGIVHLAPAYGADDLTAGEKYNLPIIHAVGLDGKFQVGPLSGTNFKEADPTIVKQLKERSQVWKSERYKHEYPFGWRTGAPLLYYAKDAWYIRTTRVRNELIKNNKKINWVPEHVKEGRFGNWLDNNRDWALSRERYWGTPLPVWTDGENFKIIGSVAELEKLSGKKLSKLDLHRPFIDEITFTDKPAAKKSTKKSAKKTSAVANAKVWRRVPEVIDCWFDSGAMPYSQWGYPVRGKKEFDQYFPADFICEAVDQTRGWFYTLLSISTMISSKSSYKNVVCLGHVLDAKGEKMSKSKGNTIDPYQVFDMHGVDALRWYFLVGAPPGNSRKMGQPGTAADPVSDVFGFFNMILNSAGFFTLYANVDQVELKDLEDKKTALPFAKRPDIDRWILSRLQQLIKEVTEALDKYDAQAGGKLIETFTDDLSNWYIRRNRRRFWKGEKDAEKITGYDTLYRCLLTLSKLLAPYVPFLAEELFEGLETVHKKNSPSVNLAGWPEPDFKNFYDAKILKEGDLIVQAASLGRAARAASGIKLRQPLSRIRVFANTPAAKQAIEKNSAVLAEELNVKQIEFMADATGLIEYRIKPNLPLIGKRLGKDIRLVQDFFKQAQDSGKASEIGSKIRSGEAIAVTGTEISLQGEDVIVEPVSASGTAGVEGNGMTVVLDTALTPELIQEGIVRDLVRQVQELRKKSGLDVTDRIRLRFESQGDIAGAITNFASYIEAETLASIQSDVNGTPAEVDIEGNRVVIFMQKS